MINVHTQSQDSAYSSSHGGVIFMFMAKTASYLDRAYRVLK